MAIIVTCFELIKCVLISDSDRTVARRLLEVAQFVVFEVPILV